MKLIAVYSCVLLLHNKINFVKLYKITNNYYYDFYIYHAKVLIHVIIYLCELYKKKKTQLDNSQTEDIYGNN